MFKLQIVLSLHCERALLPLSGIVAVGRLVRYSTLKTWCFYSGFLVWGILSYLGRMRTEDRCAGGSIKLPWNFATLQWQCRQEKNPSSSVLTPWCGAHAFMLTPRCVKIGTHLSIWFGIPPHQCSPPDLELTYASSPLMCEDWDSPPNMIHFY